MAPYEDFWWYIHPMLPEGHYVQQIDRAPTGYVPDDIPVWDLGPMVDESADLRSALEDPGTAVDLAELQDFGHGVLQCLLNSSAEVTRIYQDAISVVEAHPLRLTLELMGPQLVNFPWEYLYDASKGTYLSLMPNVSLVRGLRGPLGRSPDPLDIPLRMLVVIASPAGVDPISIDDEKARLHAALVPSVDAGVIQVEWLLHASRKALSERLEAQKLGAAPPLHMIHFICHGLSGEAEGQGQILLEGAAQEREPVPALELAQWLGTMPALRLVVLSACLTARTNDISEFGGVAQALIGAGIPAVIGMQHEIPMDVATDFAQVFYGRLFGQFVHERGDAAFERAFAAARRAISSAYGMAKACWGTPVLYVRARVGDPFPLVPLPPHVTDAQREQINMLSQQLAYYRESLQRLLDRYGDPVPATAPLWIQEEIAKLQKEVEARRMDLHELGVSNVA